MLSRFGIILSTGLVIADKNINFIKFCVSYFTQISPPIIGFLIKQSVPFSILVTLADCLEESGLNFSFLVLVFLTGTKLCSSHVDGVTHNH